MLLENTWTMAKSIDCRFATPSSLGIWYRRGFSIQLSVFKFNLYLRWRHFMRRFLWLKQKDLRKLPGFDPITFTFSKNSNYWWESLFAVIRQNIVGCCQETFCFQKFVDNAQQCFAFTPQANFPVHNLNFRWRWRDRIHATL